MKIHALFYEKLSKLSGTYAEGISRGIEHGHDREFESKIALSSLAEILTIISGLERVVFEFDIHDRVDVPNDLKWMKVSASELSELIAKRSSEANHVVKGLIFHEALFGKIKHVCTWAKQYKDSD